MTKTRKNLTLTAAALGVALMTASMSAATECSASLEVTPDGEPLVILAETDSHYARRVDILSTNGHLRSRFGLRYDAEGDVMQGFGLLYGGVDADEVLVARFSTRRGETICVADVDLSALEEEPGDEEEPGEGGF